MVTSPAMMKDASGLSSRATPIWYASTQVKTLHRVPPMTDHTRNLRYRMVESPMLAFTTNRMPGR